MSDTIRINVGPPTRDFIGEIADALACWDHPGMPSIGELSEEMQAAYRELAEWFLNHGKERVMAETMMGISADDLLYEAWAVIANAGWDGADKSEGWQEAAVRWRDKWHAYLDETTAALGVDFEAERLILNATELILELMEHEGLTRLDLAERIGKSKGHVSQLLNGERNMTLRTLAEIAHAVGQRIELGTRPLSEEE